MEHVDPYAVMRNTATLQAYRDRQKAAWRSGRPFLLMSVCAYLVASAIVTAAMVSGRFKDLMRGRWEGVSTVIVLLLVLCGVGMILGALRMRRYLHDHPSAVTRP